MRWLARAGLLSVLVPVRLAAAVEGPAARLQQFLPDLFPAGSVTDAAVGGDQGARITSATAAQLAVGFQPDDVILAAHGRPLGAEDWSPSAAEAGERGLYVVWRLVPGERPVLPPAVVGRKVIDEFATLPDSQRVPMRLAVMLANQQTLVVAGGGIVLLPSPERFDADLWLRRANPLPGVGEAALAQVADAISKRTSAPASSAETELARAEDHLEHRAFLEASERARRAMVQSVVTPQARADRTILDRATRVYLQGLELERERREHLLRTEPNFAVVIEGQVGRIQAFLPQKTLLRVDSSGGGGFLAGIRVRTPVDTAVLSDIFLLVEYGYLKYRFEDPQTSLEALSTTIQQIGFELLYRPRLVSRLKPFIRGGVGIFPWTGKVPCTEATAIDELDFGGLIGGGIDFLALPAQHLRASVAGSYRILHSTFYTGDWPALDACHNSDVQLQDDDTYDFDLDGWQVGIMLTIEL